MRNGQNQDANARPPGPQPKPCHQLHEQQLRRLQPGWQ